MVYIPDLNYAYVLKTMIENAALFSVWYQLQQISYTLLMWYIDFKRLDRSYIYANLNIWAWIVPSLQYWWMLYTRYALAYCKDEEHFQ